MNDKTEDRPPTEEDFRAVFRQGIETGRAMACTVELMSEILARRVCRMLGYETKEER